MIELNEIKNATINTQKKICLKAKHGPCNIYILCGLSVGQRFVKMYQLHSVFFKQLIVSRRTLEITVTIAACKQIFIIKR